MRIFILEDDLKIATLIRRSLRETGFIVDHVASGLDAFHMVSIDIYDAAIVEIMIPGLDGQSRIESMREHGLNAPVLILCVEQSIDSRFKGLQTYP